MSTKYYTNSFCRRDQEQYAKKLKMPTGALKELKRAYLDVNFYNLAEIRALSRKFGKISAMCLTQIYLAMSAAEDAKIDDDAILDILENAEIENIQDFIPYCLEKSLIKLYREKISDESQINPIISGSKSGLPDSDYDTDNDYDSDHDLEIQLPEFRQPKISSAIARWVKYQRKIKKPFDQGALDSMIMLYEHKPQELPDDIDHSITSNYKTLYAKPREQARPAKKSTKDTIRELYEEALLEEQNAKN